MQEFLQVDLLDFFRGYRSWRQLYTFLDYLPSWGHYKSELALDEEWAKQICDMEDAGKDVPPTGQDEDTISPLGYSNVVARLDLIADRLMLVRTAVQSTITEKHDEPTYRPLPRPETAIDRERERRTRSLLEDIDAEIRSGILLSFE